MLVFDPKRLLSNSFVFFLFLFFLYFLCFLVSQFFFLTTLLSRPQTGNYFYRQMDGIMLVFDQTRLATFLSLKSWKEEIERCVPSKVCAQKAQRSCNKRMKTHFFYFFSCLFHFFLFFSILFLIHYPNSSKKEITIKKPSPNISFLSLVIFLFSSLFSFVVLFCPLSSSFLFLMTFFCFPSLSSFSFFSFFLFSLEFFCSYFLFSPLFLFFLILTKSR